MYAARRALSSARIGSIGRVSTCQALLQHNAKVYMASRDSSRAESAIQELKSDTGKSAIFLKIDLADLASIKSAANQFKRYCCHIEF